MRWPSPQGQPGDNNPVETPTPAQADQTDLANGKFPALANNVPETPQTFREHLSSNPFLTAVSTFAFVHHFVLTDLRALE